MSDLSVDFLQPPPHFYVLFMAFTPQPPSVDVCLIIRLNHPVPQWTNLTTGGLTAILQMTLRVFITGLLSTVCLMENLAMDRMSMVVGEQLLRYLTR